MNRKEFLSTILALGGTAGPHLPAFLHRKIKRKLLG